MIDEKDSEDILNWFKASDFDKVEYLADIKHIVNNKDLTTDQKIKSIKMINEKAPKTKYDNPKDKFANYAYGVIKDTANNSETILDQPLLDTVGKYASSFTEIGYNLESKTNIDYLKELLNRQMHYVWVTHKANLDDILNINKMFVSPYYTVKLVPNTEDYLIINGVKVTFDEFKSGKFVDKIGILKKGVN